MQEDQMNQMNTDENDLQQNYQNNYSVPEYNIPQGDINNQGMNQQPYIPPQNYNYNNISNYSENNNISQNTSQISSNNVKNTSNPMIWEIISFLSWLLFISAKWDNYMNAPINGIFTPLSYNKYFIELITLIISVLGFLIYLKNIIYTRDEKLYQGLFGDQSKFHIIPFIAYSVISMILNQGANTVFELKQEGSYDPKALNTFYMIFSIISLASIIFVYIKTEMDCEWYVVMTIKKGIYSFIIVESLYHFLESIFALRFHNITEGDALITLEKTGGVFFVILQSAIVAAFALFYKNIIMIILNFLMYFTMILNSYTYRKAAGDNSMFGDAVAVIDIIMLIANFIIMIIMIVRFKEELLEL
jgi:hypothetical protein